MKKIITAVFSLVFILMLSTAVCFAEGETPAEAPAPTAGQQAGITPDNPLYPIERLIESVQVTLTFSAEGKADLLVSFANERLAEAEIMSEEDKVELVEKVMKLYVKTVEEANEKAEEAANDDKNVAAVLEKIELVQDSAEKIVIKISGILPQESAESLKQAVTAKVKKTLVKESYETAKQNYIDTAKQEKAAAIELITALGSADETAVKTAQEKLLKSEENTARMKQMKNDVKEYRNELMSALKEKEEDEKDSEDDDEDRSDKHKDHKESEKAEKKIEKINELIKKYEEKRQEKIEKIREHSEKAAKWSKANDGDDDDEDDDD